MKKNELLQFLADKIVEIKKDTPILVGINGIDAAGKTTLANELANYLTSLKHDVIRSSTDNFLNQKKVRYKKGKDSPEGCYHDTFNYDLMCKVLLEPLASGKLNYKVMAFDYLTDKEVDFPAEQATNDSILIMDGIFLFRPKLAEYWDLRVFLDVDFQHAAQRAKERKTDKKLIGSKDKIIDRYNKRYIPAQKLYFKEVNPKEKAHVVIDYNNFNDAQIMG